MFLKTIKYSEHTSQSDDWKIDEFNLGKINLVVGKNASGKSRMLSTIFNIGNLVSGHIPLIFVSGSYDLKFENDNVVLRYSLEYDKKIVLKEQLILNGHRCLNREKDGIGKIYFEKEKKEIDFQVPITQLACVARQDSIQHSFLQGLYDWGKAIRFYQFGSPLGRTSIAVYNKEIEEDQPDFKKPDATDVVRVYKKGYDKYGKKYNEMIIESMKGVGYSISEIGVEPNPNILVKSGLAQLPGHTLYVVEEDVGIKISQLELSQGMFRCLSLFIHLYYSQLAGTPDLILIDDIGEGLDFERSTSLIKILIASAENASFQLIMSTNDRFIMNNVPLNYWHIIQRDKMHCQIFNYQNSKKVFDAFAYTGLSNFDFFTTDFSVTRSNNN